MNHSSISRKAIVSFVATLSLFSLEGCETSDPRSAKTPYSLTERLTLSSGATGDAYAKELARCKDRLLPWGAPKPRDGYTHLLCARGPGGRVPAIAMGYSAKTLTGIWSSYELDQDKYRTIQRSTLQRDSAFHEYLDDSDYEEIPQPDPRAHGDYYQSGYDKGHMAPNGNMKWSQASVTASFYITNIAPQDPDFNQLAWRCMEHSIQEWANRPGKTFITVGVLFPSAPKHLSEDSKVAIPSHFYAVIYQTPSEDAEADRAVAILMENKTPGDINRRSDWDAHMKGAFRSVDSLEAEFGLDFAPEMTSSAQRDVEGAAVDPRQWPLWFPREGRPASCIRPQ